MGNILTFYLACSKHTYQDIENQVVFDLISLGASVDTYGKDGKNALILVLKYSDSDNLFRQIFDRTSDINHPTTKG